MEIVAPLGAALIVGAVASLFYWLVMGWNTRGFIALWLPLALIAWVGLAGPIRLGG